MYSDRRFLSVTGQHLSSTPTTVEERGAEVAQVHRQVFHRRYEAATPPVAPSPSATGVTPALNDAAILDKLRRAKNGPSFERLWQGDTEGYASASEADLALCGMLAFYTQDPGQIERLVEQSGLWDEKWRNRPAYRQGTIQQAIAHRSGTYTGQRPGKEPRRRTQARHRPTSSPAVGSVSSAELDEIEQPGAE
jgi:putative DNA primase/helicase